MVHPLVHRRSVLRSQPRRDRLHALALARPDQARAGSAQKLLVLAVIDRFRKRLHVPVKLRVVGAGKICLAHCANMARPSLDVPPPVATLLWIVTTYVRVTQ